MFSRSHYESFVKYEAIFNSKLYYGEFVHTKFLSFQSIGEILNVEYFTIYSLKPKRDNVIISIDCIQSKIYTNLNF